MKICIYEARADELKDFENIGKALGLELELHREIPSLETAGLAAGCDGATMLGQGKIDAPLLDAWKAMGLKAIATRTVGYDHMDIQHAKDIGLMVCNSDYPPTGVAEYTVMMMLLVLRNYKPALWRGQVNDFSLAGLQGREINNLTIGVIGTGRIGFSVIKALSGFGGKLLAYDPYPNDKVRQYAEYVEFDELIARSDVITLHLHLTPQTRHMINRDVIAKMKDGIVLINCSRGELMDMDALIEGIESKKIGGLGLDTVEGETGIIHADHRTDILKNKDYAYLKQFPNVVMTPHMAFYTDVAVTGMVQSSLEGIKSMIETGNFRTRLV